MPLLSTARKISFSLLAVCVAGCLALNANAADIIVHATDAKNQPVKDAVVFVTPASPGKHTAMVTQNTAAMGQQNLQFSPYVLAVQRGTTVAFPNRDSVKHHVYSFSATKRFELKLYSGKKASPVQFTEPGIVTLGCNIHDWMLGYIYVVDTPFFAISDAEGIAKITGLPASNNKVELWHPRLKKSSHLPIQTVQAHSSQATQLNFQIEVKKDRRRKPPADEGNGYSDF